MKTGYLIIAIFFLYIFSGVKSTFAQLPGNFNKSPLGENVFAFDDEMNMNDIQILLDTDFNRQVLGLGSSPDDVVIHGAPAENWPERAYTTINETPLVREKPCLSFDKNGFNVKVPALKTNSSGHGWSEQESTDATLYLDIFYVAKAGFDNSETIDAGPKFSEVLFRAGEPGSNKSHSKNPSFLYDVFFRVGGPAEGSARTCLVVNSNDVVIDHTWLWRADHGNGVGWDKNRCANGLIVNGNNVTVYGLFNEHFREYQTLGNGNKESVVKSIINGKGGEINKDKRKAVMK